MSSLRKSILIVLAAAGLGAASLSALADHDRCGHRHDAHHDASKVAAWYQKRQAALHDKLKLRPDQEAAWQSFVQKTAPVVPKREGHADWRTMPAPERMDRMLSAMKDREARMTEQAAAVKAFYGVLSPEQQKVFDGQFLRHHRDHEAMDHARPAQIQGVTRRYKSEAVNA
jgi:protein CpxP